MKKGDHIQVRKMFPTKDPLFPSGEPITYNYGVENPDVSVPSGYTVKGYLQSDVEVGNPVCIDRYERNGEKIAGVMITSIVKKILANRFYTDNSVYEVVAI